VGVNHLLSLLSDKYWILKARVAIREVLNNCRKCRLLYLRLEGQIMAPLKHQRCEGSLQTFSNVSTDFAGPFLIKQGARKSKLKRYICLFTCLETRAIHLEVVNSLEADAFINSFIRFVSRRGFPKKVYSDNGRNYVGAEKELNKIVIESEKIEKDLRRKNVEWHFLPPFSPHFGGSHESLIKSAKRALVAILGSADVYDEEFHTALAIVEDVMNSRPLTYQSTDPNDFQPLTPNHFIHGRCGSQFTMKQVEGASPVRRWQRIQLLCSHFWHRWMKEWLPALRQRPKWRSQQRSIQVGDVVLVVQKSLSRGQWLLGKVMRVFTGSDNNVRVARSILWHLLSQTWNSVEVSLRRGECLEAYRALCVHSAHTIMFTSISSRVCV